jgi:hypothetical protein
MKAADVEIIADACFEDQKGTIHIIEVDHTQKMIENRKKMEKYRKIAELTNRTFYFHWITTTHYRRKQLQDLCQGLNANVTLAQDHQ